SIRNCPFLSNPRAVRDTTNLPMGLREAAGLPIDRNPGVACLWITREYEKFPDQNKRLLITIGRPEAVSWWCEGRAATRAEVEEAIDSGLPILLAAARQDGRFAVEALERQLAVARGYFPPP